MHVRLIRCLGLRHQGDDFGLQLRFDLASVLIRQRTVPARIGVNLGSLQPDRPELENAHLARHLQDIYEQSLDLR